MDEYLSRRIKNWGAWQQPERETRAHLLAMAAAGAYPHQPPVRFGRLRGLLGAFLALEPAERNPFQPRNQVTSDLTLLAAGLIWPVNPLRYA